MGELELLHMLQAVHAPVLDAAMVAVTSLGNRSAVWIVLGCALLVPRRMRRSGVAILLALALCTVAVDLVIKPLVARPRPFMVDASVELVIAAPGGWSFPSGHTAKAFAAATVVALSLPAGERWLAAPAFALAALIAFSRLYLFVHFPTDVLAGACLGAAAGALAVRLVRAAAGRATNGA